MRIFLAPMEGLIDHHIRHFLTQFGGFDRCTTEFIRITDQKLPKRIFEKYCPELVPKDEQLISHTPSKTPVYVQLLGSNKYRLAENAQVAVNLGAKGIDLNFGCPAKLVNKHSGGASLLKSKSSLYDIVSMVRGSIPHHIPLTAKMRLGYDDRKCALENAQTIEDAGASELIIHARSKSDGYKPPAYWEEIAPIRKHLNIPVIANGEIWNTQDALRCQEESGCEDIMLGRGAISHPLLALRIKQNTSNSDLDSDREWIMTCHLLIEYFNRLRQSNVREKSCCDRIKQWLSFFIKHQPQASLFFHEIKKIKIGEKILTKLHTEIRRMES